MQCIPWPLKHPRLKKGTMDSKMKSLREIEKHSFNILTIALVIRTRGYLPKILAVFIMFGKMRRFICYFMRAMS